MHVDIRWLTMICLFIPFSLLIISFNPLSKHGFPVMLSAFLLGWWLFTDDKPGLVPYTEEGIVIVYYSLLVMALNRNQTFFIGLTAAFCLLSRYALIGWIPAMLVYFIFKKEWKKIIMLFFTGMGIFLLMVILPFGWGIFSKLIALPNAYINFAARVWHDASHVFRESLGWAKFFGPQRIEQLHYLLIGLSFTIPSVFVLILFTFFKKSTINLNRIPLATLKITLVIFYSFIDVPYLYLFYTSTFVSLLGVAGYLMFNEAADIGKPPSAVME